MQIRVNLCILIAIVSLHLHGNIDTTADAKEPVRIELQDAAKEDVEISALIKAGNYAEALPRARKQLQTKEAQFGPDAIEITSALNTLAWLLQTERNYTKARELFERALRIREQQLGENDPDVAVSLNNIASLLQFQGDFQSAEALYRRALAINERANVDVAESLNNLGAVLDAQSKTDEAIKFYERALKLKETALGVEHPDVALSLNNIGCLYIAQGQPNLALPLLERALSIRQKRLTPEHPDISESLNNLAIVKRSVGNIDEARELLKKSLSISETVLGSEHVDLVTILNNLAEIEKQKNEAEKSKDLFLRGARIVNKNVESILPTLSLAEQRAFLDSRVPLETSLLLQNCNDGNSLRQAYDMIFRWKGLLIESMRRQTMLAEALKEQSLKAQLTRLQQTRTELSRWHRNTERANSKEWLDKSIKLTSEKERLERSLYAAVNNEVKDCLAGHDLSWYQNRLKPDEIIADIYRIGNGIDNGSGSNDKSHSEYVAIVLTKNGEPQLIKLGQSEVILQLIAMWRQDVLSNGGGGPYWRELSQLIWEPISAKISPNIKKVWLCSDAELTRIPWQLLPDATEGNRRVSLSEIDSAREFVRLSQQPPVSAPAKSGNPSAITVVGGIDFDNDKAGSKADSAKMKYLSGTLSEIQVLASLAAKHGLNVISRSGKDAGKADILPLLPNSNFCHLATHGIFARPTASPDANSLNRRNPLVESGIALSGANANPAGILTAEELVGIDLSNCKLMTLSACDSGRGEEISGQCVMGLRASIMAAGAQSVLLSLWKVPDEPTVKLMEGFYRNLWSRRMSPIDALRQAQMSVRDDPSGKFKRPINWAGWALIGKSW